MSESINVSLPLPAIPPQEITKPKLLIGEGKDEVRFFGALLSHLGIEDIKVEDYGGKDNLSPYIRVLKRRPHYSELISIGITRDADTDATTAFASVRATLLRNDLSAPTASGLVAEGIPLVGVFILPDGYNQGMLETLCLTAVRNDLAFSCLDEYFECIDARGHRQPNNMHKARIHAWLASQSPPDLRLGEAAEKGFFDWNNPAFTQLKQFLQSL